MNRGEIYNKERDRSFDAYDDKWFPSAIKYVSGQSNVIFVAWLCYMLNCNSAYFFYAEDIYIYIRFIEINSTVH